MQILELESKSGLDRATIRHYEKENLIQPTRRENGYRDYSDENLNDLLKIKLLRQLGMSLEKIRNLQQGSEDFSAALSEQLKKLNAQIASTQRARDICQEMINDRISYATLDAESYYEKLTRPATGAPVVSKTYHEPAAERPYHPVRRLVARCFDYTLITMVLRILIYVVFRVRPVSDLLSDILTYGTPFMAVPLLALMLSFFGTTPGKWLMGLEVGLCYGCRMEFSDALEREWRALRYGYGFGIPFYSLYRLYKSYKQYNDDHLPWDEYSECTYHPWGNSKKIAFSAAIIAVIVLNLLCVNDYAKPKYRGDLTIAEFSSNYNDYLELVDDDAHYTGYLEPDGTWKKAEPINGAVVIIGSTTNRQNFVFTTEGETITGISYDQVWTDVYTPVNPIGNQGQLALLAMVMAQPGVNYFDLQDLADEFEGKRFDESGTILCGNVEISWTIKTVNCVKTSTGFIGANNEEENRIELHYDITVK